MEQQPPPRPEQAQTIRKYFSNCGCSMGSVFLFAFIIAYPVFLLSRSIPLSTHLWSWLGYSFLSAIVGKLAGILFYRLKAVLLLRKSYSLSPNT